MFFRLCVALPYFLHHHYLIFECTNAREYSVASLTLFTLCINALFIALFSFEPRKTTKTYFQKTKRQREQIKHFSGDTLCATVAVHSLHEA